MFALLALLAAASSAPPSEPIAGQLRDAIWYDLQINAMIGNGNWVGSLWYNAGREDPNAADLHIRDLECQSGSDGYRCSFTLFRDGGVKILLGERAPDRLTCGATFVPAKDGDGWAIKHIPPRRVGHSQTTMTCKEKTA